MVKKLDLTKTSSSSSKFEIKPLTEGVQEARIARIIDLGIQAQKPFKGEKKPPVRQFLFMFELADDKVEVEGEVKPAFAFLTVNLSGHEKSKMAKLVSAAKLDISDLDLEDFLGVAVSVTIKNRSFEGKTYSNIVEIGGLSDRVAKTVPDLVSDSYLFDFDEPNVEILGKLGKGMKARLSKALNLSGSKLEKLLEEIPVDSKEDKEEELDNDIV